MARRVRVVAAKEVGYMLGVNRQRVQQLCARADFPEPLAELSVGRVWDAADIEKWAKARGRVTYAY